MAAGKRKWPLIVQAIGTVESQTSAEVRVHLSRRFFDQNVERSAWKIFARERLHETRARNAILIYGNLRKRQFAIIGDEGIHERLKDEGWREIASRLETHVREKGVDAGFAQAILELGPKLKEWYPSGDNPNELSDSVTES